MFCATPDVKASKTLDTKLFLEELVLRSRMLMRIRERDRASAQVSSNRIQGRNSRSSEVDGLKNSRLSQPVRNCPTGTNRVTVSLLLSPMYSRAMISSESQQKS